MFFCVFSVLKMKRMENATMKDKIKANVLEVDPSAEYD